MTPSRVDWPGAVAVVEHVLGVGVVDRHDRVLERALGLHGAQADDAGRRLLGAGQASPTPGRGASEWMPRHEVAAVVHGHGGVAVEQRVDVGVVELGVLALDGEGGDALVARPARRPRRPGSTAGSRRRSRTSAPPALSVRSRLAVSVVTCRQAATTGPGRAGAPWRSAPGSRSAPACWRRPRRCAGGRGRRGRGRRRRGQWTDVDMVVCSS